MESGEQEINGLFSTPTEWSMVCGWQPRQATNMTSRPSNQWKVDNSHVFPASLPRAMASRYVAMPVWNIRPKFMMATFSVPIIFLVLFFQTVLCGEHDVVQLSDDNFEHKLKRVDNALVMFFAPWCGHCKKLKPEFEEAAKILKNDDPPVLLAKVDCTESGKDTCGKFDVSGYPTLKIFQEGVLSKEYEGPRDSKGIVRYMRQTVGPAAKSFNSIEEVEKFLSSQDAAIIGFFKDDSSDMAKQFKKLSDKKRTVWKFGVTNKDDVLDKYGYKDNVVLFHPKQLHSKFEESKYVFPKDGSMELEDFIRKFQHGLAGHRTPDTVTDFFDPDIPLIVAYYNVDYVKNLKGTNYWRNRVMKVAKDFLGKLRFAVANHNDFQNELNDFGITFTSGEKPVIGAKDGKGQKFIMDGEFSVEKLEKFAQDLLDGKLQPHVKSEDTPEPGPPGSVTVAVAKNFKEVVTDNGKDTLLEFYAPWCGHCKKLAPIYDELAEKMKDEDGIAIVKMDATSNDVPSTYQVTGYPTLYWAPKNKKDSPIRYSGGRELDDLIKYIAEHATDELKGWDRNGKKKKEEL
ncbi:unnamed protein product [Darwinula stevensoni]|uniref:Protein disulfide-isomerase n=1 Tax=Darwinula stevensoni TaxID=69355 RepID=A0A7R8X425_9CRUS|nr:unnamed protein product [Darwinula stevensoni]CAG0879088.1 unnamed protein product [Darwinula stevensoni]